MNLAIFGYMVSRRNSITQGIKLEIWTGLARCNGVNVVPAARPVPQGFTSAARGPVRAFQGVQQGLSLPRAWQGLPGVCNVDAALPVRAGKAAGLAGLTYPAG